MQTRKIDSVLEQMMLRMKGYASLKEARLLLRLAANLDYAAVSTSTGTELSDEQIKLALQWAEKRSEGIPIAYITGSENFYGYDFVVNSSVLIPRPETEELIELVQKTESFKSASVFDLCCGSGCIGITLSLESRKVQSLTLSDISDEALSVTRENVKKHIDGSTRIEVVKSDLFDSLHADARYDLIVSNPPYVLKEEANLLSDETARYEPALALFCENPADFNTRILTGIDRHLAPGGSTWIESSPTMIPLLIEQIDQLQLDFQFSVYRDLSRKDRFLRIVRKGEINA